MPRLKATAQHPDTAPTLDLEWLKLAPCAAITRPQAAQVLGVDERTVSRAVDSGQIPSLQIGRRVLIPRLPLLRLLGADDAATTSEVRPA